MFAALPVFAFGLGDLTVSSSLGQPLDARISLLGETRDLNPDCFKLVPAEGASMVLPRDIHLKLEQSREPASLRIQTRQAINDPAMMFTVSTVCPERIQRDYALLLDPPALPSEVPVPEASLKTVVEHGPQANDTAKPAARPMRRKTPTTAAASGTRRKVATARHVVKHSAENKNAGPKLILSGSRRAFYPESAQLSLNMDVSVLDLNRKAEATLTPAELNDENAALSHKIVHLEQLLATLQKRNAELEKARAKAAPPEKPAGETNWPYFMLGFALFTGTAAYALYRRRHYGAVEHYKDTGKFTVPDSSLSMQSAEAEEEPSPILKTPHTESSSLKDHAPVITPLASHMGDGTEVKDSVADEVEVFVAHGHADLAIHMLEDHIEKIPGESPVPWLLLLDLLKREGAESKYESYRQKCKLHFNVAMPAYSEAEVNPAGHGLESYAHIMSELIRLWPTNQVVPYLDDLIYDRRGGSRMGFDPATYRDIVLLRALRTGNTWKSLA